MITIKQLPQEVISKIAAGEVIERPVYAVKELVENALDAEATSISVHVEESGLKKITVIDNGEGMSEEDLRECFKPHTTSKLNDIETLSKIASLGFRGEALSSIAAISRMTLQSRTRHAQVGTKILVREGKVEKISPIGMPAGTQITIDYLFHNLPARKKFLKSQRTEFRHIIDFMTMIGFSYPQVHLVLTHNGRTIFDLPKATHIETRLQKLLSNDIFTALLPVTHKDSYLSLTGFLAKPPITTRTLSKQYLYVNNRPITDKKISLAVKSAYGRLIEGNAYPICILFLSLPFDHVDVNVHPRKEEVRFVNPQQVQNIISDAITQTFSRNNLSVQNSYWKEDDLLPGMSLYDSKGSTTSYAGNLLKERKLPWELSISLQPDSGKIMQLYDLYLTAPSDAGLLLYDQHAVHERILYEQYQQEFTQEKRKYTQFHFSKPGHFELSHSESELLIEYLPVLQEVGWEIEHFKGTSFIITAMPVLFQDRNYVTLLREILEDIADAGKPKDVDAISSKMIAYLACRAAVKAGDRLTKKQAKELIEQLEKVPHNATCPHGRPTKVLIDRDRMNALFKRK